MGVDRSDDFDVPSPSGDGTDHGGDGVSGRVQAEVRDRFEYYESLRVAVRDSRSADERPADAPDVVAEESTGSWEVAAERFRAEWAGHCERWSAEARGSVDRSSDAPGSWRGESGRYLDSAANAEVEERCDRIAEAEQSVISPAMREIEACDPERKLVGFEHRLKGLDRIKDKVAETMAEQPGITAREALADVSDTIRFTLRYEDRHYSEGVREDIARLRSQGFELVRLKNYWSDAQYKGINAQWMIPDSGQRFEVQFHTQTSYEAKQLTHGAYERLRSRRIDTEEENELAELQRGASSRIPLPPNVGKILNYPERG